MELFLDQESPALTFNVDLIAGKGTVSAVPRPVNRKEMHPARHNRIWNFTMRLALIAFATLALALSSAAQEHHHDHDAMNSRGEQAMGFSQTATTHHFRLLPDGGYVQVQANDAADTANRDHIRMHLQEQAKKFAAGEFDAPELTHARVPPGVPQMRKLKSAIIYRYEELDRGGRLRITSKDPAAVAAIHDFLKFQIEDHQTGDPTVVKAEP